MTPTLEDALAELDISTQALLEADVSDVRAVCGALERRADAITRVAFVIEESGHDGADLERLAAALARGEEATRKALNMKEDATEEWMRLNRILRGLDTTDPRQELTLDYSV